MTERRKSILKLAVRAVVTVVLLVWVFSRIDFAEHVEVWRTARWQFLLAAWLVILVIFWISSIKMKLILKKQGCNVGIATLFGASAVTSLYGMVMPGILSTSAKWYILKKNTGKGTNVLSSMVYNQLSLMIVMMVFGLAALILTNPTSLLLPDTKSRWLLPILCAILLTAIILISLLLLNSRIGGKIIKGLKLMFRPFPAKMRQKAEEILEQIAVFQVVGWRFHLIMALFTITANLIGTCLAYVLSARGANITAPLGVFVWLSVIIYILGRVPISIANLGVREVTLVGFLAIYDVEKSAALLMSMILFSAAIFMAVIGAIYQLSWAVSEKKTGSAVKATSPINNKS